MTESVGIKKSRSAIFVEEPAERLSARTHRGRASSGDLRQTLAVRKLTSDRDHPALARVREMPHNGF
jgi:hypothetical protein